MALITAGLSLPWYTFAQTPSEDYQAEAGSYFVENYGSHEYGAHQQNWAIVQDTLGIIYVANGSGLLEYDGARWRSISMPERTGARSLALDSAGRVYVGALGDFGYLKPDARGRHEFVSLVPEIPEEQANFTDVWRIVPTKDGVYFSTRERLFRWSKGIGIESWEPETIFALGFSFDDTFYTVEPDRGLLRAQNGELNLAPSGEKLREEVVLFSLDLDDGRALLALQDGGFLTFDGKTLEPFETEVDVELQRNLLYHGTVLADDRLAFATRRGGVYLVERSGELLRVLDEDVGLRDQHVWYAFADRDGSLWLALNDGIARIDVAAPLTKFGKSDGLDGTVMSTARHEGTLYAATSTGLYRLAASAGEVASFEAVLDGYVGQCLSAASTRSRLLVGCEGGLFEVDLYGTPRLITERVARSFYFNEESPERAYAATRTGLMQLNLVSEQWQEGEFVPDAPAWALSMEKDEDGALWLTTTADGIVRITDIEDEEPLVHRFDANHGVPAGWSYVTLISDMMLFHTQDGVFQFDPTAQKLVPDDVIRPLLPQPEGDVFLLEQDPTGEVWFVNESDVGHLPLQLDNHGSDAVTRLQRVSNRSLQTLHSEESGVTWLGGQGGLFRYAPRDESGEAPHEGLQIRGVTSIDADSLLAGSPASLSESLRLPRAENALRFAYSLPSYDGNEAHMYQVRLDGFDEEWSGWTSETERNYTNLPAGSYVFRARAMDAYGNMREEGTFSFEITPRWYETWPAFLLFGAGAIGLVVFLTYGGMRYRMRRLRSRKNWLEGQVQQRTNTLEEANEQLEEVLAQNREFTSIAAHDLKNPLVSIIGFSNVLIEDDIAEDERREFLSLIRTSAERLHGIVCQLQDVDRLDRKQLHLQPESVDLCELMNMAVRRNYVQASQKNLSLHLEAPQTLTVYADGQYLQRAIENLLSNAIKFSSSGKNVWLGIYTEGKEAVITIRDEGPGFSEQDIDRMYGKLQRLSARPTDGESSTGLGLYIVQTIIDMHGGSIEVDTAPGEGATFTIRLPTNHEHRGQHQLDGEYTA